MSDRQKAGLHGPLHAVHRAAHHTARRKFSRHELFLQIIYDSDGKLLQTIMANSFGNDQQEFSTTYTYDSAGRLLTTTSTGSSPVADANHTYDEKGRLLSISSSPGETTVFSTADDRHSNSHNEV